MTDWGPVFVAVVLFILLSPGLLFQIPGKSRFVEFSNFQTSGPSILLEAKNDDAHGRLMRDPLWYLQKEKKKKFLFKISDEERRKMSDWGPVFVAVVLFILLTPGLLIQVPGKSRAIEFGNFQTSGVSILVHSIIYFALICILLLAIGIHMYVGS
ncbi:hypothetical protein Golob_020547 [Gossypium lobatum]|uniref:Transmembrane protein n=1 Tax=Gossypium lobatum TaxID=34289 RepID=A0A7J8LB53_9ROSI|nr:hypothetical protein [Gossypium lobatum]